MRRVHVAVFTAMSLLALIPMGVAAMVLFVLGMTTRLLRGLARLTDKGDDAVSWAMESTAKGFTRWGLWIDGTRSRR